jgi:hypothetical protein
MRWLRILILAGVLQAILGVGVALADTFIQMEITATGNASASCPSALTATPSSDYLINLTWENATGNDTLGTVIRVDYGAYPTGPTSGDLVYSGNGTSTTHSVNLGVLTEDIYYRAWTIYAGPTYSVCYTSAMVEVPGVAPGTGGTIDMSEIADILRLGQYLALPALLVVLCFWKRNIVAFIAAIMALGLVLPYLADDFGNYMVIPAVLLMVGLALMFVRDAWEREVEL